MSGLPVQVHDITDNGVFLRLKSVLGETLQLGDRVDDLRSHTPLIGNLPELDSMAILTVIIALEENFHFMVADDDDMSEAFSTMASLTRYVEEKLIH